MLCRPEHNRLEDLGEALRKEQEARSDFGKSFPMWIQLQRVLREANIHQHYNITNAKLGVIGISNDLNFRKQLNSKVRSSLCEKEVSFSAYDATELCEVLRQREAVAFQQNVLEDGVIDLCAAFGAKDLGDARQALDLLLESGDIARETNANHGIESYVRQARERLQTDQIVKGIDNYSQHGQLVLWALTILEEQGDSPVRTREIRQPYETLCEHEGSEPISDRAIREYLAELEKTWYYFLNPDQSRKGRRKVQKHELDQPVSSVKSGLKDLLELMQTPNTTTSAVSRAIARVPSPHYFRC